MKFGGSGAPQVQAVLLGKLKFRQTDYDRDAIYYR
jgi:hypothetical protein